MMAAKLDEIRLFPGSEDLLRQLSAGGTRIAIVSSNSESNIRQILGEELSSLVEHYECGASFFGKSRKLRRVIKKCGLPAEAILSVGDEMRDLTATLDVGLPFGAVSWGLCHAHALETAGAPWSLRVSPRSVTSYSQPPPLSATEHAGVVPAPPSLPLAQLCSGSSLRYFPSSCSLREDRPRIVAPSLLLTPKKDCRCRWWTTRSPWASGMPAST